ncbi:ATP-binding protein [Negativicoccus succinicivorans]|uniref:AAA family ATPase n=1 Tax=Negativicoccus succinicivorans TaxID=620903 RepID=UPI00290CAF5E|nr:ATP-binding protein [Negativicoccus succinicivorans]MDU5530514.1 ATP-binding protein [Negativicoccus succinicivorans]
MILNFRVGGFCSINEIQELTLTPFFNQRIKGTKYEDTYIETPRGKVAKSAIIFGQNSTGKTNFLLALTKCCELILLGADFFNTYNKDFFCAFQDEPETFFELKILSGKDIFTFLIKFGYSQNRDDKRIYVLEERLQRNKEEIYHFFDNKLTLTPKIKAAANLQEIHSVPSTSTILSKIRDNISGETIGFLDSVDSITYSLGDSSFYGRDKERGLLVGAGEFGKDLIDKNKDIVCKLFKNIDHTITNVSLKEVPAEKEPMYKFVFYRRTSDGKERQFEDKTESQGIKHMILLVGWIIRVMQEQLVLIVDELDAPISTRSLLGLFVHFIQTEDNRGGQLIVTTHSLELFDINIFPPSQIYIAQKTDSLNTVIHSLADYDVRTDRKRLAERFLQGAFD